MVFGTVDNAGATVCGEPDADVSMSDHTCGVVIINVEGKEIVACGANEGEFVIVKVV